MRYEDNIVFYGLTSLWGHRPLVTKGHKVNIQCNTKKTPRAAWLASVLDELGDSEWGRGAVEGGSGGGGGGGGLVEEGAGEVVVL